MHPVGRHRLAWLKHAFAVDPPGPAEPDEAQARIVERVCREIVRRGLTTPAMMALEMGRPLNHLSAQVLTFFQPFVAIVGDATALEQFTGFLEQRGSIDYISARIAALDDENSMSGERRGAKGPRKRAARSGAGGPRDKE
ncbi:MAG: hypothetical protein EHM55_02505 [Acidobacteria bacterium]|nr:MAG: hypothetical protein EHM55_02505 [Acidobacteriota bacterium]